MKIKLTIFSSIFVTVLFGVGCVATIETTTKILFPDNLIEEEVEKTIVLPRALERSDKVFFHEISSQKVPKNGYAISWAPTGDWFATGSEDGFVRVWSADGRLIKVINAHGSTIRNIKISPSGTEIASASNDGTVKIWNVDTGESLFTYTKHMGHTVHGVTWSPDGSLLASCASDGSASIWHRKSGVETVARKFEKRIWEIVWSPDGKLIALGMDGTGPVHLIDPTDGKTVKEITNALEGFGYYGASLKWSSDAKFLVTGSHPSGGRVWDVETGKPQGGMKQQIAKVALSPDSSLFISASTSGHDGSIYIVDSKTGERKQVILGENYGAGAGVTAVDWSPKGGKISAQYNGRDGNYVKVWQKAPYLERKAHKSVIQHMAWSPDSKKVATTGGDESIQIWSLEDGSVVTLRGHVGHVRQLSWNSDGTKIVSASDDKTIRIWDPVKGVEISRLEDHKDVVTSVDWQPNGGDMIASVSSDRTLLLWSANNGALINAFKRDKESPAYGAVEWSEDGDLIYAGSYTGLVDVWEVDEQKKTRSFEGGAGNIRIIERSAGNGLIACVSDGGIRVVDPVKGTITMKIEANHDVNVNWSPSGKTLLSAIHRSQLRIHDVSTGDLHYAFDDYSSRENQRSIAMSPNGQMIATGRSDGTVCVWALPTQLLQP